MNPFERYSRQMRVPGFDANAQVTLQHARVLIVGAGGLGAPVAAQLAGAGVGVISIVDFDVISLSNLHRQWLYTEADIGAAKVETLARHLTELNQDINVTGLQQRLSIANAGELIEGADLVVDAADNFPTSYLLSDLCAKQKIPLLTASVNQRFGYLGIFCASGAPSLRAVFPRVPLNPTSCDLVGVTGPAVSVVAGLQAQAGLDFLLQLKSSIIGKLVYVDLRDFSLRTMDCRNNKEPTENKLPLINADQIGAGDWVIDVREPHEAVAKPQVFRVDQALPLSGFDSTIIKVSQQRKVFACQSGQRAMVAAQQALDAGLENVAIVLPSN